MIDLEVAAQVAHGGTISLDGGDVFAVACERQRKGAGTAVKVHGDLLGLRVQRLHGKVDEDLGGLGVDLEERWCRKAHLGIGDILRPRAFTGEDLDLGDAASLLLAFAHHADHAR